MAATDLQEAIADLQRDQDRVSELFRSVSATLAENPTIGRSHALSKKWEVIREDYRRTMRESQRSASRCAWFLSQYSRDLQDALLPGIPLETKMAIALLLQQEADKGQKQAVAIDGEFGSIRRRISQFPDDVASYKPGFWVSLLNKVKSLCKAALGLIKNIVQGVTDNLFGLGAFRFRCGPAIFEYMPLQRSVLHDGRPSENSKAHALHGTLQEASVKIKRVCHNIDITMSKLENFWGAADRCCAQLITILERTRGRIYLVGFDVEAYLGDALAFCFSLRMVLNGYAKLRMM